MEEAERLQIRFMRGWLLKIHLHAGLLCAPGLLVFGLSSLLFNHAFAFVAPPPITLKWQQAVEVHPEKDNDAMAVSIRDSLGLMGWTLPWKTKRDSAGALVFDIERPGKSYTIRAMPDEAVVRVEERRKGFWQVFNSLHGLTRMPNSGFTPVWGAYSTFCVGYILFAAGSGIFLWVKSRRERMVGLITLTSALLLSLALMLYVVMKG